MDGGREMVGTISDIKPGHPIWEEIWEKSRPGGISHLNQLFEAKLELVAARAEIERLKESLEATKEPRGWFEQRYGGG